MECKSIDARGLSCPQPVVLAKQAIEEDGSAVFSVLVDNEAARDNVSRLAESKGCSVSITNKDQSVFELLIQKCSACDMPPQAEQTDSVTYLFDDDHVGANMELGKVLMNGFLAAMKNLENKNCSIVLISKAVRLGTEGSYVLEVLQGLEEAGFRILLCGTCLDFYKIRENVRVGTISNALEILECMTSAAKIIKF